MQRTWIFPAALALLLAGCTQTPPPVPTEVVRPTERPALATLVPTFTVTAQAVAAAVTELPGPIPTDTVTVSPTVRPSATATRAASPTSAASPTPAPSPTRAPTRAPTRPSPTRTPAPSPVPAPGAAWHGEYFNNPDLNGDPALVRSDGDLNFDWGLGSPDPSVPTDHFSARWTRSVSLAEGRWRFHATADDGVRVYVDGFPIIDQWHTTASVTYNTSAPLSGGNHELRLDYYDNIEAARIHLWWEPDDGSATDPAHAGAWRGDYYDNKDLSGTPTFSRDDAAIYFDWGDAGPGRGVGGQEFSVRWTRQAFFPGGDVLFTVKADDGVRLWLDWAAIIDEWHDNVVQNTYELEKRVGQGTHTVVLEYYQGPGSAMVQLGWQPMSSDWLANLHTCMAVDNSWVNVYRLAPNNRWEQLPTDAYGDTIGGELSMWGVPVDASYGWDGQPYRVELWVGGKMTASQGNIFAGQPAFRIMPGQDVHTSWTCGAALPSQ
jgi:hypothetical protein